MEIGDISYEKTGIISLAKPFNGHHKGKGKGEKSLKRNGREGT